MHDDEGLNEALCQLTQLTDEQLAGLDQLAEMDAEALERFAARTTEAWEANRQAVVDSDQAVADAMEDVGRIEMRCYAAARARNPRRPVLTEAEKNEIRAAVDAVDKARHRLSEVKARFKAGVTADQLEGR